MNGDVIKSFLVGLGFGVDDSSLAKFNKAIASAALRVTALYASVKASAAGIVYGISKVSEGFEQMGYEYHIIAPAINKALVLRRELLKAYSAAGINIVKVVRESQRLNFSLTKTKFALEAIYKSVASRFFNLITKQSDVFRRKLYENMPKIQNVLEKLIKVVFKAFDATVILGERLWSILTRVYDFFVKLDKATDGWSTFVIGLIAAWKLLNLEFLATPLGMLLAGFLALVGLWDDFKTFEEGGESLINWGPYVPVLKQVGIIFDNMLISVEGIAGALNSIVHLDFDGLVHSLGKVADAFVAISNSIDKIVRSFGFEALNKILDIRDKIDNGILGAFKSPNVAANIQNNPTVNPVSNPVGSGVQNSVSNQNVKQQTYINVMGSTDAGSIGKAVAGEQNRVNSNMTRNLKGATR